MTAGATGDEQADAQRARQRLDPPAGLEALFAQLSREPDLDAPELAAYDAADELLLTTAEKAITALAPGELAIIGDRHGALALGAIAVLGARSVRVHQDPILSEQALASNARRLALDAELSSHPLGADLLTGARVVLVQLPRSLDALAEIAWAIARYASPEVTVFAGGRVKHMTRRMNEVLAERFAEVAAGLGARKSRVLTARRPRAVGASPFPRRGTDPELGFALYAYGATFGGPTLDHGSRLLLAGLADAAPGARRIVDLGSGNGVLAVSAALARPGADVIATDQSDAARRATLKTASEAGVADRVRAFRADALAEVPDGWADLILLNPPFHSGAIVHAGVGHRLIRACARALVPGGELRLVHNSHLAYRPLVERVIGPTRQVARDRTFTVLSAKRRS